MNHRRKNKNSPENLEEFLYLLCALKTTPEMEGEEVREVKYHVGSWNEYIDEAENCQKIYIFP